MYLQRTLKGNSNRFQLKINILGLEGGGERCRKKCKKNKAVPLRLGARHTLKLLWLCALRGAAAISDFDMAGFASSDEGFRMFGSASDDHFSSVAGIGYVNGDGIDDVAIAGADADPLGRASAGLVVVFYGHTTATTFVEVDPTSFGFGAGGFKIYGALAGDFLGTSIAPAKDFNGDGIQDVIIGAEGADPGGRTDAGAVYVIFGKNSNFFGASVDLADFFLGVDGFQIFGNLPGDALGHSVNTAGDINGDTFPDIIVGAYLMDHSGGRTDCGGACVFFGHSTTAAFLDITVTTGATGFRIYGAAAGDQVGTSVGTVGDINGDGFADFMLGVPYGDPSNRSNAGITYKFFGHSGAFEDIDLISFTSGASGFRILGPQAGTGLGQAVGGSGDINGDGYADVFIGGDYHEYMGRPSAGMAIV